MFLHFNSQQGESRVSTKPRIDFDMTDTLTDHYFHISSTMTKNKDQTQFLSLSLSLHNFIINNTPHFKSHTKKNSLFFSIIRFVLINTMNSWFVLKKKNSLSFSIMVFSLVSFIVSSYKHFFTDLSFSLFIFIG